MSNVLYPVVTEYTIKVYGDHDSLIDEITYNTGSGRPHAYASGKNIIIQYPNGDREVLKYDENNNFVNHEFY